MAKVPVITEAAVGRGALPGVFQRPSATPSAFGAGVGRAVERLGGTIQEVERDRQRRKREDDANVALQGLEEFNKELRPFLYAPETGAMHRVGSNARGLEEDVAKKTEELRRKYGKNLSPVQQKAYNALVNRRISNVADTAIKVAAKERKTWLRERNAAIAAGNIEDVTNEPNNSQVFDDALIMAERVTVANNPGVSEAVLTKELKKNKSDLYTAAVYGKIKINPLDAEGFFKENKENFDTEDRDKIEEMLGGAVHTQNVQIKTDEIIATTDNFEERRNLAKDIKNPELREDVLDEVEHEQRMEEAQRKEKQRQVFSNQQAQVERGLPVDPRVALEPAQRSFLEKRKKVVAEKAVNPHYDTVTVEAKKTEWIAMDADKKAELTIEELTVMYRNDMSTKDYQAVVREWSSIQAQAGKIKTTPQHRATLSFNQIGESEARGAKIIPDKPKSKWSKSELQRFDRYMAALDEDIKNWEDANGKKADTVQVRNLAKEINKRTVIVDPGIFSSEVERPADVVNPTDRESAYVPIDKATDEETGWLTDYEKTVNVSLSEAKKQRLIAASRLNDPQMIKAILEAPNE